MQRVTIQLIAIALLVSAVFAQVPPKNLGMSPKDVIEELWNMATRGALLTPDGWATASALFVHPEPFPGNQLILVFSNDWGTPGVIRARDDTAQVDVGFIDAGHIDSKLRYFPPKPSKVLKTGMLYELVLTPTHGLMFGSDGKTVLRQIPGPNEWKIKSPQGPPWTTVNTAVRYVLEVRNKSTDPVIRKNANETLARLLQLN